MSQSGQSSQSGLSFRSFVSPSKKSVSFSDQVSVREFSSYPSRAITDSQTAIIGSTHEVSDAIVLDDLLFEIELEGKNYAKLSGIGSPHFMKLVPSPCSRQVFGMMFLQRLDRKVLNLWSKLSTEILSRLRKHNQRIMTGKSFIIFPQVHMLSVINAGIAEASFQHDIERLNSRLFRALQELERGEIFPLLEPIVSLLDNIVERGSTSFLPLLNLLFKAIVYRNLSTGDVSLLVDLGKDVFEISKSSPIDDRLVANLLAVNLHHIEAITKWTFRGAASSEIYALHNTQELARKLAAYASVGVLLKELNELIRIDTERMSQALLGSNLVGSNDLRRNLLNLPTSTLSEYIKAAKALLDHKRSATIISFLALNKFIELQYSSRVNVDSRLAKIISRDHYPPNSSSAYLYDEMVLQAPQNESMRLTEARRLVVETGILIEMLTGTAIDTSDIMDAKIRLIESVRMGNVATRELIEHQRIIDLTLDKLV